MSENSLRSVLEKLKSYNEDILAGRINYRPEDHIAVADAALAATQEPQPHVEAAAPRTELAPREMWLTGEQLERMHNEHTTGPDPETLDTNWDDLACDIRVLREAPPNPRPELAPAMPTDAIGELVWLIRENADGFLHNSDDAARGIYMTTLLAHIFVLREEMYGIGFETRELSEAEQKNIRGVYAKLFKKVEREAPPDLAEALERLVAIVRDGYHNDTCGAVLCDAAALDGGTQYPCNCWKSKVAAIAAQLKVQR